MIKFAIGALVALAIACASGPPGALAHIDGIGAVTPGDASPMQPSALAGLDLAVVPALDVVVAPAFVAVAKPDSGVRTGDTGEPSTDSVRRLLLNENSMPLDDSRARPASIFAFVAEPVEPSAALRSPTVRLTDPNAMKVARLNRIDRPSSRTGGALVYLHPARG